MHVDVHNHWLRQEHSQGRILVEYQLITTMVADGLTKALTRDNHQKFVAMLNLDAIESLITARAEAEEAAAEKDAAEQASGGGKRGLPAR